MKLFFHLFKTQNNLNHAHDSGLISLRHISRFFETYYENMKHFKDQIFLVTLFTEKAHTKICKLEIEPSPVCTYLFRKFWSQSYFLKETGSYVYKEDDLSHALGNGLYQGYLN